MKLTIKQITEARSTLDWLGKQGLRPGLSLQLTRNIMQLNPHYNAAAEKERELYEKHGKEVEKEGKTILEVIPANQDAFDDEYEEFIGTELEIDIQVIDFKNFEAESLRTGFTIAPLHILAIEWMLKFDEPEAEKPGRKRHAAKKQG